MSRYRTTRLPTGGVISAGLDARRVMPDGRPLVPRSILNRAIVTNTYVTDNPYITSSTGERQPLSRSRKSVECDVILVRSNVPLSRVPVMQRQHGVNNVNGLWIPRPCSRVISTGEGVSFQPVSAAREGGTSRRSTGTPASLFSDLDGDHVLVGFVENDGDYPVIMEAFTHEATRRLVVGDLDSIGWEEGDDSTRGAPYRNEYYLAHYGTEVRVNAQGDLLIDTVGAFTDPSTEDASGSVGQVRIRVKDSQRFTVEMDGTDVLEVFKSGAQVRVDLGEGADQRIPLGDDQVDAIKSALDAILDFANLLATATPAPPNGALTVASVLAAYGPAPGTLLPRLTQAKADLDAALSDLAKTKKS